MSRVDDFSSDDMTQKDFEEFEDVEAAELSSETDSELESGTLSEEVADAGGALEGTELENFDPAAVEEEEFIEETRMVSIVESILFSTDRPQSVSQIKQAFAGTNVRVAHIRRALDTLRTDYAGAMRGVTLEEINGGYQLRTKIDNLEYLRRMAKARPFRLSGPALEVLAIVAYKQPCPKAEVDEIRGVESGHLMRGLMDRGMIHFEGKSELPGKPMLYGTTKRFLEIFGLRNIRELPSLSEIDELIPEGIGEFEEDKTTLSDLTDDLSQVVGTSYSEGEEELTKIAEQLQAIDTSTQFFEDEKRRMRDERDAERARDIREALTVGELVENKDRKWLERYELAKAGGTVAMDSASAEAPQAAEAMAEDLVIPAAEEAVGVDAEPPTGEPSPG